MNVLDVIVQQCPVCQKDMRPKDMMLPWFLYGTEYHIRINTNSHGQRLVCADCTPNIKFRASEGSEVGA